MTPVPGFPCVLSCFFRPLPPTNISSFNFATNLLPSNLPSSTSSRNRFFYRDPCIHRYPSGTLISTNSPSSPIPILLHFPLAPLQSSSREFSLCRLDVGRRTPPGQLPYRTPQQSREEALHRSTCPLRDGCFHLDEGSASFRRLLVGYSIAERQKMNKILTLYLVSQQRR